MPRNRLEEAVEQLHADTLEAIRSGNPKAYRDNVQAYEHLLMAFPRAWQAYRQAFVPEVARRPGLLERSAVDVVVSNLYSEIRTVIAGNDVEIARSAVALPEVVAVGAIELGATALLGMMLNLLGFSYVAALQSPTSGGSKTFQERVPRALSDISDRIAFKLDKTVNALDSTDALIDSTKVLFHGIRGLLKELIDLDNVPAIRALDAEWNRILEGLHPEMIGLDKEVISALRARYEPDDPAFLRAEQLAEYREHLTDQKRELERRRQIYRLELCSWGLYALRRNRQYLQTGPFRYFAEQFRNLPELAEVIGRALEAEFRDELGLSNWLLSELPEREAHFIGTDVELMRTFLVLAVLLTEAGHGPQLPAEEWIQTRMPQIESLSAELQNENGLWSVLLPQAEVVQRFATVMDLLRDSADRQAEREAVRVRDATLDQGRVDGFKSNLRTTWRQYRLAPALFRLSGTYEEHVGAPDPDREFGASTWIPKDGFTADPRVIGIEGVAGSLGRNLADSEIAHLVLQLQGLTESAATVISTSELRAFVGATLDVLARAGYRPLLCLIPLDWRVAQALELEGPRRARPEIPEVWNLPDGVRSAFVGQIGEAAVFRHHRVPNGRICVVDLGAFGVWQQFRKAAHEDWLRVEIQAFDADGALELASKQPGLFNSAGDQPAEARAAEIRKNVLLSYGERFTLNRKDAGAGRWIAISPQVA